MIYFTFVPGSWVNHEYPNVLGAISLGAITFLLKSNFTVSPLHSSQIH